MIDCEQHGHYWYLTGKQDVHVEFPTKTNGKNQLLAIYVQCCKCSQMGFKRPNSRVIYTWRLE